MTRLLIPLLLLAACERPSILMVEDAAIIQPGHTQIQNLRCPDGTIGISGACTIEASAVYRSEFPPEQSFRPRPGTLECVATNPPTETEPHSALAFLLCARGFAILPEDAR